jgi:asparagine synthase (glutamine-hydrolysing)
MEVERYMRNTLLRDSDVFSMAHSLELRTPFVDHEVLRAALSIGNFKRALFRKRLLAEAIDSDRVREILRKPKRGFALPMAEWLRGPLASRVDEVASGPIGDVCDAAEVRRQVRAWRGGDSHDSKVWALVVLDAWLRRRGRPDLLGG